MEVACHSRLLRATLSTDVKVPVAASIATDVARRCPSQRSGAAGETVALPCPGGRASTGVGPHDGAPGECPSRLGRRVECGPRAVAARDPPDARGRARGREPARAE